MPSCAATWIGSSTHVSSRATFSRNASAASALPKAPTCSQKDAASSATIGVSTRAMTGGGTLAVVAVASSTPGPGTMRSTSTSPLPAAAMPMRAAAA